MAASAETTCIRLSISNFAGVAYLQNVLVEFSPPGVDGFADGKLPPFFHSVRHLFFHACAKISAADVDLTGRTVYNFALRAAEEYVSGDENEAAADSKSNENSVVGEFLRDDVPLSALLPHADSRDGDSAPHLEFIVQRTETKKRLAFGYPKKWEIERASGQTEAIAKIIEDSRREEERDEVFVPRHTAKKKMRASVLSALPSEKTQEERGDEDAAVGCTEEGAPGANREEAAEPAGASFKLETPLLSLAPYPAESENGENAGRPALSSWIANPDWSGSRHPEGWQVLLPSIGSDAKMERPYGAVTEAGDDGEVRSRPLTDEQRLGLPEDFVLESLRCPSAGDYLARYGNYPSIFSLTQQLHLDCEQGRSDDGAARGEFAATDSEASDHSEATSAAKAQGDFQRHVLVDLPLHHALEELCARKVRGIPSRYPDAGPVVRLAGGVPLVLSGIRAPAYMLDGGKPIPQEWLDEEEEEEFDADPWAEVDEDAVDRQQQRERERRELQKQVLEAVGWKAEAFDCEVICHWHQLGRDSSPELCPSFDWKNFRTVDVDRSSNALRDMFSTGFYGRFWIENLHAFDGMRGPFWKCTPMIIGAFCAESHTCFCFVCENAEPPSLGADAAPAQEEAAQE